MRGEGKAQKRAKTTFTSQKGPKVRQTWGERKEGMEREGEWRGRGKSTQPCLWEPRAGQGWAGVHGGERRQHKRQGQAQAKGLACVVGACSGDQGTHTGGSGQA